MDVPIEDATMDVRTVFDRRAGAMLADVSPGAEEVVCSLEVKSSASPEQVAQVIYQAERTCHTAATLKAPPAFTTCYVHNGVELDVPEQKPYTGGWYE